MKKDILGIKHLGIILSVVIISAYALSNYDLFKQIYDKFQPDYVTSKGVQILYYPNGVVKMEASTVNDKLHGPMKTYYESGELDSEREWENGKVKDGIWNSYHENGNLKSQEPYENGELNGWANYYNIYGELRSKSFYKDGRAVAEETFIQGKNGSGQRIIRRERTGSNVFQN